MDLDRAIGLGGIPETGLIEFYGPQERSLKNLTFQILKAALKQSEAVAFIDTTHAAQAAQAAKNKSDAIPIIPASNLTNRVQAGESLIRKGVNLLAVGPLPDANKKMNTALSQTISRLYGLATEYQAAVLLLNPKKVKLHTDIEDLALHPIALYADVRIEIKPRTEVDDTAIPYVEAVIVKNRCAEPFGKAQFPS